MKVYHTSKSCEWETPQDTFDALNLEFGLHWDVAATRENSKCGFFYDEQRDGLSQDWNGKRCWMNPPYGKTIGNWVEKAATGGAEIVVALLPARTDTRWWHSFIQDKAEVRFIKGRLKFGGSNKSAPFPSCVVIFRNEIHKDHIKDDATSDQCNVQTGQK
jgi:phage N-6-adenine-methyltransferase